MEKREGSEGDTIFSALNSAIRIVSYKGRQIRFRTLGKQMAAPNGTAMAVSDF
jgi:hypothetical protein